MTIPFSENQKNFILRILSSGTGYPQSRGQKSLHSALLVVKQYPPSQILRAEITSADFNKPVAIELHRTS